MSAPAAQHGRPGKRRRLDLSRLSARRRAMLALALTALVMVVLGMFDRVLVLELADPDTRDQSWRWALKQVGDLRLWLIVAGVAFALVRDWRWPAGLLGSAALAGGLAEVAKLVIGRERPVRDFVIQNDAMYVWKDGPLGPFLGGFWDSSNLGLPSSHTAVAFGGAAMLGMLAPKLRLPALILAAGCGLSRVLAGAHFPTDAALGAAIGVASAALIARLGQPKPDRTEPTPARDTIPPDA